MLFEEAQKHQPSIIFFDEIDGLAPVRSSKQDQVRGRGRAGQQVRRNKQDQEGRGGLRGSAWLNMGQRKEL